MKNLRKVLSLLLCFVMAAGLLPISAFAATDTEKVVEHKHMYRANYINRIPLKHCKTVCFCWR